MLPACYVNVAAVCVVAIEAADVQCTRKHASLQGAGPIRPADSPKSRKLLTLGMLTKSTIADALHITCIRCFKLQACVRPRYVV
jgi:hypothetical protein